MTTAASSSWRPAIASDYPWTDSTGSLIADEQTIWTTTHPGSCTESLDTPGVHDPGTCLTCATTAFLWSVPWKTPRTELACPYTTWAICSKRFCQSCTAWTIPSFHIPCFFCEKTFLRQHQCPFWTQIALLLVNLLRQVMMLAQMWFYDARFASSNLTICMQAIHSHLFRIISWKYMIGCRTGTCSEQIQCAHTV